MMRPMRLAFALAVVGAGACGGKTDSTQGQDAGTDSDVGPDGFVHPTPALPCPTVQPADGTACSKSGIECEYGDDPRWTCNWIATCDGARWSVATTNDAWCPTPATNPDACPATFAAAQQGNSCDAPGTPCQYAQGFCACSWIDAPPMPDAGQLYDWQCAWGPAAGCPAKRPRLGTSCNDPSLGCDYGACDVPTGLSVSCDPDTMTWTENFGSLCAGAN